MVARGRVKVRRSGYAAQRQITRSRLQPFIHLFSTPTEFGHLVIWKVVRMFAGSSGFALFLFDD